MVYTNTLEYAEHLALVKGDVAAPGPVHVRMHAANLLHDIVAGAGTADLHDAMRMIDAAGRGVVVVIRDWRLTNMSEQVKRNKDRRVSPPEIRDYGIGAQILADLGRPRHGAAVQQPAADRRPRRVWAAGGRDPAADQAKRTSHEHDRRAGARRPSPSRARRRGC